jgi:predicted PurR-regulated permease PerM
MQMSQADTRDEQPEPEIKLNVSLTQILASALASVSAAVIASLFGVAGTIIGTAVVSVVATTGSAVYALWMRRTRRRLRRLREQAVRASLAGREPTRRQGVRPHPPPPVTTALGAPVGSPADVTAAHGRPAVTARTGWRQKLGRMRLPVLGGVLSVFVLAAGVVTVIEVIANKPLSAVVNNTPGSGLTYGGGHSGKPSPTPATTVPLQTTTTAPGQVTPTTQPATTTTSVPATTTTTPATTTTTTPTPSTSAPKSAGTAPTSSPGG